MRIVAGLWRGRRLAALPGEDTRPTADRVRQAMFDMLAHAPWAHPDGLRGRRVLDAFAGTGALGLEALSRGAEHAVFLDRSSAAIGCVRANLGDAGRDRATLIVADATRPPKPHAACDLVFLDPPYGENLVPIVLAALEREGWIARGATIVVETASDEPQLVADALAERVHGRARISFHRAAGRPDRPDAGTAAGSSTTR